MFINTHSKNPITRIRSVIRRIKHKRRVQKAWVEQGKPTDYLVVLHRGENNECPHGRKQFTGWHWERPPGQNSPPVGFDQLWTRTAERYVPTRNPSPYCPECQDTDMPR